MIIKLSWKFSILHPFSPAPPGSANLLMLERIGEILAGRAVYVTLWPFTRRERQGLADRHLERTAGRAMVAGVLSVRRATVKSTSG